MGADEMRTAWRTVVQATARNKRRPIMARYTDTVSEATEELSASVREANQAITDSVVEAQERTWKFAQSIVDHEVELLKSHAESTRTMMEKLVGEPEKDQALLQ